MHRRTAIKHLRTLAGLCDTAHRPTDEPILVEVYAYGDILEPEIEELDFVRVALVLDLPAEEVTWLALPDVTLWLSHHLRLDKAPVHALRRPAVWPVQNHFIRRPVRIWTVESGADERAITAISDGAADRLRLPEPAPEDEAEQLAQELEASLTYLRRVQDSYHQREWRAAHKSSDIYPEDYLWQAVEGYLDLLDVSRALNEGSA